MNRLRGMNRPLYAAALASCIGLSGCVGSGGIAGLNDSATAQQLEVHAILDHREIAGAGCVLENDAGRWFVVAPGRVTVTRSSTPLAVSCKRDGAGSADERWAAQNASGRLVGQLLSTAGLRDYFQSSYAYPTALTVIMRPATPGDGDGAGGPGTPVF
jgi:hypothetical protein